MFHLRLKSALFQTQKVPEIMLKCLIFLINVLKIFYHYNFQKKNHNWQ